MSGEPGTRWYVVQTQPNAERKALFHLGRQGYRTYMPQYLKRSRHARQVKISPAPLFPRYAFVAIEVATQQWRAIQSTLGVSRLVCNGDRPAAISSSVVEQLRARQDEAGLIQLDARPPFAHGEQIQVLEGAFASCFGLYEGMCGAERVAVLLDLLGRKVRVSLSMDVIAAA